MGIIFPKSEAEIARWKTPVGSSIEASSASITQRTPAMDVLCRGWYSAESKYVQDRERRAFEERRIKERLLYMLKIKKSYRSSVNWNYKWSSCMFGVLQSRASALAETWGRTADVSPRVTEAVAEGLEDCEIMVRYFEKCLASIAKNKSEHTNEGRTVARLLKKMFPKQRDLVTFYEYNVLRIESPELQEMELDGRHCRELRAIVAQHMQMIKRDWPEHGTSSILIRSSASSDQDNVPSASWAGYHLLCYTSKLTELLSARIPLLCAACQDGDIKTITRLLRQGVWVDSRDQDGVAPLMHALRSGHVDACRLLLQHRASPNKQCSKTTPLLAAVESKSLDLVKLLLQHGADVNARSWPDESRRGITPLIAASQLGLASMTLFLLNEGADPRLVFCDHVSQNHRITALHVVATPACAKTICRVAMREAKYGVEMMPDGNGRLPMHWALAKERWEVAAVQNPQSTNAVDSKGNSLLHEFCMHLGSPNLDKSADRAFSAAMHASRGLVRKENNEGRSPMSMMAEAVAAAEMKEERAGVCENDEGGAAPNKEREMKIPHSWKAQMLRADADQIVNKEFNDLHTVYCFGSVARMSEEQRQAGIERLIKRTEFENKFKTEQQEMFDKMVGEYKLKAQA